MKKKTLSLLTVLCLAFALMLTACGGESKDKISKTDKLSLDNYAVSIADAREQGMSVGSKGYTTAAKQNWTEVTTQVTTYQGFFPTTVQLKDCLIYTNTNDDKGVYNYKKGIEIVSGFSSVDVNEEYGYALATYNGDTTKYSLYSLNGTKILDNCTYIRVEYNSSPTSGSEKVTRRVVYATNSNVDEDSFKFLGSDEDGYAKEVFPTLASFDKEDGVVTAKEIVTLKELFTDYSDKTLYPEADSAIDSYDIYYTENNSYSEVYEFVRDGKTTKLEVPYNGYLYGYADGKILYFVQEILPHEATKGYNVISLPERDFTQTSKLNIKYYTFEIASGKVKEIKPGYFMYGIPAPLYNVKDKKYDAYVVTAVNTEGGIATISDTADLHNYVIDADGKVAYETTGYSAAKLIRLKEDRYFVSSYSSALIINGKGEVVANLGSSASIEESANAIIAQGNGYYGAVDYDGKVVLPFKYRSKPVFYGGAAYVYSTAINDENYKILTASDWKETDVAKKLNVSEEANIYDMSNGLLRVSEYSESDNAYKYSVYNYAGTRLINNLTSASVSNVASSDTVKIVNCGGDYYIIK